MTTPAELREAADRLSVDELLVWLKSKLTEAKRCLAAREDSAQTWSNGSSAMWKAVGAKETRAQRLEIAATQKRIAEQYRRDVDCLQTIIEMLAH